MLLIGTFKFLIKFTSDDIGFNGIVIDKEILFEQGTFTPFMMGTITSEYIVNSTESGRLQNVNRSEYITSQVDASHLTMENREGWTLYGLGLSVIKQEVNVSKEDVSLRVTHTYYNSRRSV